MWGAAVHARVQPRLPCGRPLLACLAVEHTQAPCPPRRHVHHDALCWHGVPAGGPSVCGECCVQVGSVMHYALALSSAHLHGKQVFAQSGLSAPSWPLSLRPPLQDGPVH